MKWLLSLILTVILTGFCSAWAATPEDFMSSFQSSRVQFPSDPSEFTAVNPGRYPPNLIWLFQEALRWKPLGKKADYIEGCKPEDLYQAVVKNRAANDQAVVIERHKKKCGKSFQNGSTWSWLNSLRIMGMELKFHEHPYMKRVVLNLPDGTRVKGLLALKGDLKTRPFVVIRLGIYSNVEEFLPERYLLTQMYEQGLANILVLENMSSADFIANNKHATMGGYEEGLQNIRVAQILRDKKEPLSKLISSLHFVGVSFGGHGILFASLLNDLNRSPIQSFMGICPVVNLKDSFSSLVRPNIMGVGADFWSSLRLEGLKKKDPILADYEFVDVFKLRPVFLPRMIKFLEEEFEKNPPDTSGIILPAKFLNKTLWQANDFWAHYRNVKSPVLVFGTVSDAMVSPADNIFWLDSKARDWKSNMGVVIFEEGFHCTLPIAYDWASTASLFNARIMAYDSSVKVDQKTLEISDHLETDDVEAIEKSHFEVAWVDGGRSVILKFPHFSVSIPLEDLDFKFEKIADPERTSIERWIYQNVQGRVVRDGDKIKAHLFWPHVQ